MRRPELAGIALLAYGCALGVETQVMTYAGALGYGGYTPRDGGRLAGIYLGVTDAAGSFLLADWERSRITLVEGEPIRQQDLTLMVGTHPDPSSTVKLGFHLAWDAAIEDPVGRTMVVDGALDLPRGCWLAGGFAASRFQVVQPPINVVQISSRLGWYHQFTPGRWISPTATASFQAMDRDPGFSQQRYWSLAAALNLHAGRVGLDLGGWFGRRCYYVAQEGFVVYDLPAVYRHGWSAGASVDLWRGSWLRLEAGSEIFRHLGATGDAQAQRLIVMLGLTL